MTVPQLPAPAHRWRPVMSCLTLLFLLNTWIPSAGAQSDLNAVKPETAAPDFLKAVRPIFDRHCVSCHGPDQQEGNLRLDRKQSALHEGENYAPAIVAGDANGSPLFQFVSSENADLQMPPKGARLSVDEVTVLRDWINQGAVWPDDADSQPAVSDHWSFQPLQSTEIPAISPTDQLIPDWIGKSPVAPVDAFIADRLRNAGLKLSSRADRRTLIRRLYLVMHGLLPTPEQVAEFENDSSPQAWETLVDQVLSSPRYGERWAQHWLDLVRFGETNGFETNRERPNAWPYRDYVIRAFNADLPYNEFVRQQLAGDQLGSPLGTGFLVAGPYDLVKSRDIALTRMQRQDELTDIVNTVGTAFLGLTMGCAKCHNHKFDPI
ncbi:MAG: DUF1549 domain-containing protein, partial [Planctomycetaceae bacterium]|nr:DUF1549 domain-containing protein [Planctomycetaceae bacterium]